MCIELWTWSDLCPWYLLFHLFAALCYRNAKAYDKARDTYERAANTYYKNHAYPTLKILLFIFIVSADAFLNFQL